MLVVINYILSTSPELVKAQALATRPAKGASNFVQRAKNTVKNALHDANVESTAIKIAHVNANQIQPRKTSSWTDILS